ncbi:glutathione ABC transporter substrate-binding protein [Alkaliphilus pronyensis]|uniref:Glutathione ABC transporter substrate-binding protein n=1 Tax=Alkaliphilus pronyensis TaxID=1482732 RepID=A0A6I0F946_9FIRM|nr:glutathione ABC transporter substrate-binding protein [Alkaliphilus pronyensis]KAB3538615.1 glutathione ABC transporter substrate-binding protein [Alkaliphilus pronyensis]
MFKNKKLLVLLSMVLVFALFAVGCSQPADDTATPGTDDTNEPADEVTVKEELIVGQGADAVTLDPHSTNDQPSSRVSKQIYETLVAQNENMEIEPSLAESWESIDDTTVEFKLKQGVKFHNGEELKASDVKFTILRALDSSHIGHIVGQIDGEKIEVIDDYTIRLSTKEPFAPLLAHLAHTAMAIMNEKAVTEGGEDYGQNPVGTGPFKFNNWVIGDSIELVKFDEYHGEPAKLKKVTFRNIAENTTRTIELETGGIDIAYDIPPTDVSRVEENSDLVLQRAPSFSTSYIGFNAQKKPYDDVRVRQAINYAIDMASIIEAVYQGVGAPAKGPLGPNVFAGHQGLEEYGFNVEKAKELMADAGYADGFDTTIWTNENQQRMDIAEIVQNQLKAININTEVKVMEWGAYLEGTAAGEHDMFILGWVTVTGDPDYGLYALFHSSQFGTGGNRTFWSNDRVDELLDAARVETDPSKREEYYLEAQEIIRDEAPWVFTWIGENLAGVQKNVKGFTQHPAGHHSLHGVYFE